MEAATYLLRFDDICPTMNWEIWNAIERVLDEYSVKPIVAVVPDNQDPNLVVSSPDPRFWDRVRKWKANGWTIAVHGYQHKYVNGSAGIIGLTSQSEFAGVRECEQAAALNAALNIFRAESVEPSCWVAPAHSFDETTVQILARLGVNVVSDGLGRWPYRHPSGTFWIPQQMWTRFRARGAGVWTVCCHHNSWRHEQIASLRDDIRLFRPLLSDVCQVVNHFASRRKTAGDWIHETAELVLRHRIARYIERFRKSR